MSTKIEPRDFAYVPVGPHHKPHPAIVLRVTPKGLVVLIAGTGTARELPNVRVKAGSREAKALHLYKDTYFYEAGLARAPAELITTTGARCPPELFQKLLAFAAPVMFRWSQEGNG